MVTLCKRREVTDFGCIVGDSRIPNGTYGCPAVAYSILGFAIRDCIARLPDFEPAIKVLQYSIMPDHVHLLLFIQRHIDISLGNVIARLKVQINQTFSQGPVFTKGFNDQIITHNRPLDTIFRYIRENPYRLAVRREHPEFFRRVYNVKIGDNTYQTYGNQFLLHNPFKNQVVIHRRNTPDENARLRDKWLHTASNGGVLVSPFISPAEKAIRTEAESLDANIILIQHTPFPDRYKPSGHDFDLCCRGHLLIISPAEQPTAPELSRTACLTMNALAATIASTI